MPETAFQYLESETSPAVNQVRPKLQVVWREDSSTQAGFLGVETRVASPRIRRNIEFDSTPTVNQENRDRLVFQRYDPFTQAGLLSTNDNQVKALIYLVREFHESLADRLAALFNAAKAEKSTSPGISYGSLVNFYDFLRMQSKIKKPVLSLTPDYNIYASWRAENRVFSAHFLPTGELRFVLFKPNPRHPKRKIRIAGITTSDALTEIVSPKSLNGWVFHER